MQNQGFDPARPEQREPVILIAGFGRCGSSLAMRMLDFAGIPVVGHAPAYEEIPRSYEAAYWIENYAGKAIKVIDPHIKRPPRGVWYQIIWLQRDPQQQAMSAMKFLAWLGAPAQQHPKAIKKLRKQLERDRPLAVNYLISAAGAENCFNLEFKDLIDWPASIALRILDVVRPEWDIERRREVGAAMGGLVKIRTADCYQGMLEETLWREVATNPRQTLLDAATA